MLTAKTNDYINKANAIAKNANQCDPRANAVNKSARNDLTKAPLPQWHP